MYRVSKPVLMISRKEIIRLVYCQLELRALLKRKADKYVSARENLKDLVDAIVACDVKNLDDVDWAYSVELDTAN